MGQLVAFEESNCYRTRCFEKSFKLPFPPYEGLSVDCEGAGDMIDEVRYDLETQEFTLIGVPLDIGLEEEEREVAYRKKAGWTEKTHDEINYLPLPAFLYQKNISKITPPQVVETAASRPTAKKKSGRSRLG
ncbi:MAG TPA: hypothetical protein VL625_02605 [Patescibacteria group bacterium]|nr:hypothetical protein [Patescibacteria group bacterium]